MRYIHSLCVTDDRWLVNVALHLFYCKLFDKHKKASSKNYRMYIVELSDYWRKNIVSEYVYFPVYDDDLTAG